ncbi:MAG: structural protein P5 [Alistipes sp.]|nr:structural protein P5 [Alistipes sp.]
MTRGLRNRNPGNIRRSKTRYLGEVTPSRDAVFKQFETMAWGYRAMFVLLDSYRRRGYGTLRQMIARYAPPVENHTENYIRCVATWSGVDADEPLDTHDRTIMLAVVAAMSRMENGREAVMSDVEAGWTLFIQHKP